MNGRVPSAPRRGLLLGLVCVALVGGSVLCGSASANQLTEITIPARNGEIPTRWLPRYAPPPRAKVLLPDGYDPDRAYPVLVLLVGLSSNYSDWSDPGEGEIATTAKGFPGIIVMPEGGDGWYADWWNKGRRGDPSWESYVLDQVIPQIHERYKILPGRRNHALAGVSMGGLGTAYLGGRLPGYFGSIAVISGLVDLGVYPSTFVGLTQSTISQLESRQPLEPEAVEGPPGGFYERGHNPVQLAANLRHTRVFMATGDGRIGPVLEPAEGLVIKPASDNYAAALRAAGVDVTYQSHAGGHEWPNFRRELRDAIAWGLFAPVAEDPEGWDNDTVAQHGELWGFSYRFDAPPNQVVRVRRRGDVLDVGAAGSPVTIATDDGCTLHAATPARLEIPARPCATARLTVRPKALRAGRRTRVRVTASPPVEGATVSIAGRRARTDGRGVAELRVCVRRRGRVRVGLRSERVRPATTHVASRGPVAASGCG